MKITKKKIAAFLAAIIILAAGFLFLYQWKVNDYQQTVSRLQFSDIDISSLPDGVYEGECNVDFISARVTVYVEGGQITSIDLTEHKNERGKPAEKIIETMVAEQKVDVEAVSGATNSSKVIKKAVETALLNGPLPNE